MGKLQNDGCEHCHFGIVGWKDEYNHLPAPLWEVRCALLNKGQVHLCTCKAGLNQRHYMERIYIERQKEPNFITRLPIILEKLGQVVVLWKGEPSGQAA